MRIVPTGNQPFELEFSKGVVYFEPILDLEPVIPPGEEALTQGIGSKERLLGLLAGRRAAKRALAALGFSRWPLPWVAGGGVFWPPGVVGAVSHKGAWACAAALRRGPKGLGLDLEDLAAKHNPAILSKVATAEEIQRFALQGFGAKELALFSAKEAIFKAVNPYLRQWFGFHQAQAIELNEDRIHFELASSLVALGAPKVIEVELYSVGEMKLACSVWGG